MYTHKTLPEKFALFSTHLYCFYYIVCFRVVRVQFSVRIFNFFARHFSQHGVTPTPEPQRKRSSLLASCHCTCITSVLSQGGTKSVGQSLELPCFIQDPRGPTGHEALREPLPRVWESEMGKRGGRQEGGTERKLSAAAKLR